MSASVSDPHPLEGFRTANMRKQKPETTVSMNYYKLYVRYGVSDRAVVTITSVVLYKTKIHIIDNNKFRREIKKTYHGEIHPSLNKRAIDRPSK